MCSMVQQSLRAYSDVTTVTPKKYVLKMMKSVFRIRMDPGFFADPYPDLENPDPSVFCFNLLEKYKRKIFQIFNYV